VLVEHEIGEEEWRRRLTMVDEVVERRRKKNRNAGARERIEEGRSSLGAFHVTLR
jgi:hypothetical protein